MGLPTVSMGLLAAAMPPGRALAIVIVPAIVTNIWQTFVGGLFARHRSPAMAADGGTVIGIWLNAGIADRALCPLCPDRARGLLVIYAIMGLSQFSFNVARRDEKWIGGIVGVVTGRDFGGDRRAGDPVDAVHAGDRNGEGRAGAGARGVLHRCDAGARVSLSSSGMLTAATALPGAVAMVCSFTGVFVGQAVRSRMQPEAFRRWFLIAMIFLGLYLSATAIFNLPLA